MARRSRYRRGTLGLDLGTSGLKAVLFDDSLRPIASVTRTIRTTCPGEGRSEQSFAAVMASIFTALTQLAASAPTVVLDAIGLAAHRSSLVAWDPIRAAPLTPVLLWNDRRAAGLVERWRASGSARRFERVSRLPVLPYFFGPRATALLERGDLPRESLLLTVESAVLLALGAATPTTDATFTARTLLARPDGVRDDALLRQAGLVEARLARLVPTCGERGVLASRRAPARWRGAPIRAALADQSAAYFGLTGLDTARTTLTIGTGLFAARGSATSLPAGVFPFPVPTSSRTTRVGAEVNDPSTGTTHAMLRRLCDLPTTSREFDLLARRAKSPASVIPAATGIGAPWLDPGAKAAILGLGAATSRADIARGLTEGVAARAAELLALLGGRDAVCVGGGGAASRLLLQRIADRSGRVIERSDEGTAGALGAAALARIESGECWDDVAATIRDAAPHRIRFTPGTTSAERRALRAAFSRAVQTIVR